MPRPEDLDTRGLDISAEQLAELLAVDIDAWREQLDQFRAHFGRFGDRLPHALDQQLDALAERLA